MDKVEALTAREHKEGHSGTFHRHDRAITALLILRGSQLTEGRHRLRRGGGLKRMRRNRLRMGM